MLNVQYAAIVAGGKSSRMGRDKALLSWENRPLVAHIAQILRPIFFDLVIVTSNAEIAEAAQLPALADRYVGRGPLAGIHAALQHFGAPTFVVACDMPFLNADFIRCLSEDFSGTARVPLSQDGFEPLHAVYAPACAPLFEHHLQSAGKMPPLRQLLNEMGAQWIAPAVARGFDANLTMFVNWNCPSDLPTLRK